MDLDQKEFAALTGFSANLVSWYENARAKPSAERLIQILRLAGTDAERRPILQALKRCGVLASDLAPAVLASRGGLPTDAAMLPVSSDPERTAISETALSASEGIS
jgi:transcriptional regulator with XRE-family HTH domain